MIIISTGLRFLHDDFILLPMRVIVNYDFNYNFFKRNIFACRQPLANSDSKSPDEWATTKQACRDELIYIYIYSLNICNG